MKRFLLPSVWIIGWLAIDEEHFAILDSINGCVDAYDDGRVQDYEHRLDALVGQVRGHFDHEESAMAELAYPGLAWHRDHHQDSLARLTAIRASCAKKGFADEEDVMALFHEFLADIAKADLRFQTHLQEQGRLTQAEIEHVRRLFHEAGAAGTPPPVGG